MYQTVPLTCRAGGVTREMRSLKFYHALVFKSTGGPQSNRVGSCLACIHPISSLAPGRVPPEQSQEQLLHTSGDQYAPSLHPIHPPPPITSNRCRTSDTLIVGCQRLLLSTTTANFLSRSDVGSAPVASEGGGLQLLLFLEVMEQG